MNSRKEALLAGAVRYSTGKRCVRGHISERYAASGNCVACWNERTKTEEHKARTKRYRSTPEFRKAEAARRSWPWVTEARRVQNAASKKTPHGKDAHYNSIAKRRAIKYGAHGRHTLNDRRLILDAQNNACLYCEASLVFDSAEHDHYIPLSKGGSDARYNIVMTCAPCNRRKYNKMPFEFAGFCVKLPIFWNESQL